jgi:hypothetical protein
MAKLDDVCVARHLPYVVLAVAVLTAFPHNMKTRQRLVLQNLSVYLAQLTESVEGRLKKGREYLYMCEEMFSLLCVHDSIKVGLDLRVNN